MILALWLGFLALATILTFVGLGVKERPLVFTGLFFFFLLGTITLAGEIEYKIGENVSLCSYEDTYQYGNNYTGYHWDYLSTAPACSNPNDQTCVRLFHTWRNYSSGCQESTIDVYDTFSNTSSHTFGFFLTVIAGLGMWLVFVDWRKAEQQ